MERVFGRVRAMTRRILFIILGAILLLLLILLLWWWFFSGPQAQQIENGSFGTGGASTTTSQTTTGSNTNVSSQVTTGAGNGNNVSTNVPLTNSETSGTAPVGGSVLATIGSSASAPSSGTTVTTGGTNWLPGGGPTSSFVPSAVNQLNNGATGGQVTIFGSPPTVSSPSDLGAALAVAGVGTALCTAGLIVPAGGGVATAATVGSAATLAGNAAGLAAVPVNNPGLYAYLNLQLGSTNTSLQAANYKLTFLDCVARTIGKAIVNQITAGVVNWINGGFNGQPAFVQNFQQFLGNVADQAAGAYIQGSSLAFLCSPFSLQIKIAIAQSYANRGAQSCTLSKVIGNVNNFMNGDFSQGGWAGLLSFTTTPTNNPYGAYAYAQVGLAGAQSQALTNANKNISPGGFISFQQVNCPGGVSFNNVTGGLFPSPTQSAAQMATPGCTIKTTTPGTVIQNALDNTQNSSQNMLAEAGVSGSFDAIISALITQLVTKTLYGGLSNLSGTAGYASDFLTPDQQQAETSGNALLTTLGNLVTIAENYGSTEQGSISDIQNVQQQLENLSNCWETASTSPALSSTQTAQASQNAAATQNAIAALQTQVDNYNNNITNANNAIALLQELQTQTLSVGSTADVAAVTANLNSAQASGQLISQDQADNATDDRTTLDSQLQQQSTQTANGLLQCQAFGQPATQ